jgi:hypothetical protein
MDKPNDKLDRAADELERLKTEAERWIPYLTGDTKTAAGIASAALDLRQIISDAYNLGLTTVPEIGTNNAAGRVDQQPGARSLVAGDALGNGAPAPAAPTGDTPRTDAASFELYDEDGLSVEVVLADECAKIERELASAKRDADHFFQLSGRYLEELNAVQSATQPSSDVTRKIVAHLRGMAEQVFHDAADLIEARSTTGASSQPQHVCGLQGYNPMIDAPCPGCEARSATGTSSK